MSNIPEIKTKPSALRRAIWRGSSIIAPPLVTLLLLIWIASAVEDYVLRPVEAAARNLLVWSTASIYDAPPADAKLLVEGDESQGFEHNGKIYVRPEGQSLSRRRFIPKDVIVYVDSRIDSLPFEMNDPQTAAAYYQAYVKLQYMPRWFTIPLLLLALLSILFFVGKFLAAGVGRMLVNLFERIVNSVPLVRNLYSSVKQVTDFVLNERDIEFTRVVAIEHPRKGIWALGFVTSEQMPPLTDAIGDEMVAVFVPTSPMPMTGFSVSTRKRELLEVDITIDQAVQFIVSCGVVCPPAVLPQIRSGPSARIDPPEAQGNPEF